MPLTQIQKNIFNSFENFENIVRSVSLKVKLSFILRFGSSVNAFHLYTVTNVACSNAPYNVHAWLYKGRGYC